MSRTENFEKARRRKERRKAASRLLLTLFVVCGIFFAYTFRYEITSQGIGVLLADRVDLWTKQSRYPVALEDEPKQLITVGRRAAVVTGSSVNAYSPTGEEKIDERISGKSTLASAAGNYLLTYDRGGNELNIYSGETELFSLHTDGIIQAAAISERGAFAVATANGSSSDVTVYDSSFSEALSWTTKSSTVLTLGLDARAQRVAVGSVYSDKGMLTSQIRALSVKTGKDIIKEQQLPDEVVLDLAWQTDGTLTAVTDRSACTLRENSMDRVVFSGSLTAFSILSDGAVAAVTGEYLTAHETTVYLYSPAMQPLAEKTFAEDIRAVFENGESLLIFTGERLLRCTREFVRESAQEIPGAINAAATGNTLYYTTVDHLYKVNLR